MKSEPMKFRKVSELHPLPENPRTINKADLDRLVDSIRINGFWEHRPLAIVEREGKFIVLCGNQRLKAAKRCKVAEVPTVLYTDVTPEEEADLILRDNINNGEWDYNALQVETTFADVNFDFIGLSFPSEDEEPKKGKGKKTAKAVEQADESEDDSTDTEDDESDTDDEITTRRLSIVQCTRMCCMRATTKWKYLTCCLKCKLARLSCHLVLGAQTADYAKM